MRHGKGKSGSSSPRTGGDLLAAAATSRYDRLDALRGLALVWMAVFHFCFDLSNYHLISANFYADPLWTTQRTCILSLFLLCAGAGQAVATAQGQTWARFWRRWGQILACAMLVSLSSWFMFPRSYIYFGVLHGMAVMLILARLSAPLRGWLWPMGLLLVVLPQVAQHPWFDTRLTNWVGLVTHKPVTEDYVPVLPWLGVMLWGLAGTQWMLLHRPGWLAQTGLGRVPQAASSTTAGGSRAGSGVASSDNTGHAAQGLGIRRGLVLLGRWSLTFYMVHQPVLIGGLMAWMTLTGRSIP